MNAATDLQSQFARAVEAEYEQRAAVHRAGGLGPEDAHLRALEEAKQLGRVALEELRRRGLFPLSAAELEGGTADVA